MWIVVAALRQLIGKGHQEVPHGWRDLLSPPDLETLGLFENGDGIEPWIHHGMALYRNSAFKSLFFEGYRLLEGRARTHVFNQLRQRFPKWRPWLFGLRADIQMLDHANLEGCDLGWANLRSASLRGVNLSYALLDGADLSGADLTEAKMSGGDFRASNLAQAFTKKAVMDAALLPENYSPYDPEFTSDDALATLFQKRRIAAKIPAESLALSARIPMTWLHEFETSGRPLPIEAMKYLQTTTWLRQSA